MEKTVRQRINVGGILELWDKIELLFEDRGRTGKYLTRVEDILDAFIVIDRPTLVSGDALFTVGASFAANFFKPDSAYTFAGHIVRRSSAGTETYLIPIPVNIERNQRRRYFRVSIETPVTIIVADTLLSGTTGEEELREFEGCCLNLSGNGMLVRSRSEQSVGSRLFVDANITQLSLHLQVVAIVRRLERLPDGLFLYGIEMFTVEEFQLLFSNNEIRRIPMQFQSFNELMRAKLLHCIFAYQVTLKKKGLI